MDYTKLFYWLTVADNFKSLFVTMIIIFTIIAVISTICYIFNSYTENEGEQTKDDEKRQRMSRKWMWWSIPLMIFFWMLNIATPSKRDALLIVAGGQSLNFLSTDESAKQIPSELSSFVLTELRNMAKDAEIDLNIKDEKQKVLESVKELSAEELIKKLKNDDTLKELLIEED